MSRMPKDIVEYMKESTEVISEEAVATSIVAILNVSVGKTTWISAMSDNLDNVKSEPFRDTTLDFKPLNSTTLLIAQKQDPAIAEILRYKTLDWEFRCRSILGSLGSGTHSNVLIIILDSF